jgi:hypothetical protein
MLLIRFSTQPTLSRNPFAPLPFSPRLEPYNAVPLLPGAILCTAVAFDPLTEVYDRRVAFGMIALPILVRMFYKMCLWSLRGILLLTTFEVLVPGLGLLRHRLVSSETELQYE